MSKEESEKSLTKEKAMAQKAVSNEDFSYNPFCLNFGLVMPHFQIELCIDFKLKIQYYPLLLNL